MCVLLSRCVGAYGAEFPVCVPTVGLKITDYGPFIGVFSGALHFGVDLLLDRQWPGYGTGKCSFAYDPGICTIH